MIIKRPPPNNKISIVITMPFCNQNSVIRNFHNRFIIRCGNPAPIISNPYYSLFF
nr:MAG TPA_asm: hypothetical protein [Caudoviricetes sp.]